MATALGKRVEPFVVPGGLKGQISQLPLPDMLQHLRESRATGILSLVSGGARKALYVKAGRVVFASSNLPNDRLGELLLREGKITVEEYESSIRAISKGKRQGRVLVEMGALSPKDLWEGVQFHIREMHRRLQARGGRLLLATWPVLTGLEGDYPFLDVHEAIGLFCHRAGIPWLDLLPALQGQATSALWVHPIDAHPNEIAHRLVADRLAPAVRRLGEAAGGTGGTAPRRTDARAESRRTTAS